MSKLVFWKSKDPHFYILGLKSGDKLFHFVSFFEDALHDTLGKETYDQLVNELKNKEFVEVTISATIQS